MSNEPPQNSNDQDAGANFLIQVTIRSFARSVAVFLRKDLGSEYLGVAGVAALLIIPLFAGIFPRAEAGPLLWFLAAYFGMVLVARVGMFRRYWRGEHIYSFYSGTPRLATLLPFLPEWFLKVWVEPPLVFFIGVNVATYNNPLGSYLVWAGLALFICEVQVAFEDSQRTRRMRDARIEQLHTREQVERFGRRRAY